MKSPLTAIEAVFWQRGKWVIGVDEVGRGPLAGPVTAAVVAFEPGDVVAGVNDSKKLSERERMRLYPEIIHRARAVAVGMVGPRTIERVNIYQATKLAMWRALNQLKERPSVVITDAMRLDGPWQEIVLIRGDGRSQSVAAASIVAKVVRDRYMQELAAQFPQYGFAQHKGYATVRHREAVMRWGISPAHRQTFIHGLYDEDFSRDHVSSGED